MIFSLDVCLTSCCVFVLCVEYSENHNRFFSFTRTSQETSLILEEEALADFPPYSLTIVKTQWRALSVSLGSVGYST